LHLSRHADFDAGSAGLLQDGRLAFGFSASPGGNGCHRLAKAYDLQAGRGTEGACSMVSDESNSTIATEGFWHQLAARVRHRRVELGFKENAVAAHLGVGVEAYGEFESGGIRIPAALLAELSDLFKVPLFFFFQDLRFKEEDVDPSILAGAPVLTVATTADQLAILAQNFMSSSQEGRRLLLLLARAFAQEAHGMAEDVDSPPQIVFARDGGPL